MPWPKTAMVGIEAFGPGTWLLLTVPWGMNSIQVDFMKISFMIIYR